MIYELPTTVNVGGVKYPICGDGDYRAILDLFSVLEDTSLNQKERIVTTTILFYCMDDIEDLMAFSDIEEAVMKMFQFINCGKEESQKTEQIKLVDWEKDGPIIVAAVNKVANKEIRAEKYLHWWTFLSYYMSIGESVFSTVVSIRDKMMHGNHLEKWEREYRRKNPEYFKWDSKTAEQKDLDNWILQQWNSGG